MVVVTQTRVEISTWGSGVYKMAQKVPMPLMDGLPHLQDPRGRVNVYRTFGSVKKSIHINWGSYWLKLVLRGYDILNCKVHIPFIITFCLVQSSNLLPWQYDISYLWKQMGAKIKVLTWLANIIKHIDIMEITAFGFFTYTKYFNYVPCVTSWISNIADIVPPNFLKIVKI